MRLSLASYWYRHGQPEVISPGLGSGQFELSGSLEAIIRPRPSKNRRIRLAAPPPPSDRAISLRLSAPSYVYVVWWTDGSVEPIGTGQLACSHSVTTRSRSN